MTLCRKSSSAAEELFRHKVIRLLLSWHHSGFSVHNAVTVPAGDGRALEALARYCELRGDPSILKTAFRTVLSAV